MKFAPFGLAACAAALACALPAAAQQTETLQVVAQPAPQERAALIDYYGPIGQSFTAFSDTLTSVEFQFKAFNPGNANLPINLSLVAGEQLAGAALFSTAATLPIGTATAWYQFALPSTAVTRGAQYTFVLSTGPSFRNAVVIGPGYTYADPAFPNGRQVGDDAYEGGRLLSAQPIFPECNGAANNCDLNFRLTGDLLAAAVPEPSSWALLILGFGAVGVALRSRRKARPQFAFA